MGSSTIRHAILRAVAVFLGPPVAALLIAFTQHPELDDVLVVVLFYHAAPYWELMILWQMLRVRLPTRARIDLVLAAPIVAYLGFWSGGLGFGSAMFVAGLLRR